MTHEELRVWLEARQWTQKKLATELGMTLRQINRWATGRVAVPKWFAILKDKI